MAVRWRDCRRVPVGIARLFEALATPERSADLLRPLNDVEWRRVLDFCDRAQLTLVAANVCGGAMPDWARERTARNLASNRLRLERLISAWSEIEQALAPIDYVVLKGFTQWNGYVADPALRVQYDFDLYFRKPELRGARDALVRLGYEPLTELERLPTDHLPVMIRRTGWDWRGDYFDPQIPASVDLHFRFWDMRTEEFDAPGVDSFWERRKSHALDPVDALGYAALHLLRHLLRGSVRPYHVYELAWFLDHRADDFDFWNRWNDCHEPELRRLEAICFALAAEWFGRRLPEPARAECERLPEAVRTWMLEHAASPIEAQFHPRKTELWLHLALVDDRAARRRIFFRRLAPLTLPGPVDGVHLPDSMRTWRMRLRSRVRYARHVAARASRHLAAAPVLVAQGFSWWSRTSGLSGPYWRFLATSWVFNLGVFLIILLYNLYLSDLGHQEDVAGRVSSLHTAGSLAGAIAAGAVLDRWKLGRALRTSMAALAAISAVRAFAVGEPGLLVTAFLAGAALAMWPVAMAPAITRLVSERARTRAFSLFFASGIGVGAIGGLAGGRIPDALQATGMTALDSKRFTMLIGAGLIGIAAVAIGRVQMPATSSTRKAYPRSRFVFRFLASLAVWNLATGAFNPFFNVYFSRHLAMTVSSIGQIFAAGQVMQVGAILIAPLVHSKLGLAGGIAVMQLATAAALGGMAGASAGAVAAAVYALYMTFQWMSEPGLYALLMGRVAPEERSGASSLNMCVVMGAQIVASAAAGAAISRIGYGPVFWTAACLAAVAAFLFRRLQESPPSPHAETVRE